MIKIIETFFWITLVVGIGKFILLKVLFDLRYYSKRRWSPLLFLLIGLSDFRPYIKYRKAESFEEKGIVRVWPIIKWAKYQWKEKEGDRVLEIFPIF